MSIAFLSDAISAMRSASAAESWVGSARAHEVTASSARPAPYRLVGGDVLGHAVRHQVPDRQPFTHPPADRRRGHLDQRHVEVAHVPRPRQPADLDPDRVPAPARALEHRHRRQLQHLLRLVPAAERRRLVPAQDQEQLVVRRLLAQRGERLGGVRGRVLAPPPSATPRSGRRPATASSAISSRASAPGSSSISRCGATPTGMNTTRSSSSWTSASCAHTRWPMCGGLNAPPRIPTRKPATRGPARSLRPRTCRW